MLKTLFLILPFMLNSCASKKYPKFVDHLSPKMLRSIMLDNLGEFKNCTNWYYQISGDHRNYRILFNFVIGKNGKVSKIKSVGEESLPLKLANCLKTKIKLITFPKSNQIVEVNQPFGFKHN